MSHRIAFAGLLSLVVGACSAPTLSVTPRVSQFDIGGDVGVQEGSDITGRASIESLGVEEDSSALGGRVDLVAFGHWTVSAQQSSHDGEGVADAELSSGSITISPGDPVRSELDFGVYSGSVTFDLVPSDVVEVGLGLGIALLDTDARFIDRSTGEEVAFDELVPVPNLAGRVGVHVGPFEVSALVNWIDLSYDGTHASFLDIDSMVRLRVFGDDDRFSGYVALGYRFMNVQADYESDGDSIDFDVDFDGPWIGLAVSF